MVARTAPQLLRGVWSKPVRSAPPHRASRRIGATCASCDLGHLRHDLGLRRGKRAARPAHVLEVRGDDLGRQLDPEESIGRSLPNMMSSILYPRSERKWPDSQYHFGANCCLSGPGTGSTAKR
jgi:hypothetical protein